MVWNGPHAGINFSSVFDNEQEYLLIVDESSLIKYILCGFHNYGITFSPGKLPGGRGMFSKMVYRVISFLKKLQTARTVLKLR